MERVVALLGRIGTFIGTTDDSDTLDGNTIQMVAFVEDHGKQPGKAWHPLR